MIPIKLTISGFLSYRETAELDFSSFSLACISGQNGAGKSSLLDAFTWVLFGQARKHDESLVNLQSKAAEVALVFEYEGNTYRVKRTLPKGKTSSLEFQILEPADEKWKVLTQHTLRETQNYIERTLRLDYETFVNASFFLQDKADQFTQQKASDRKRILGSILGLEVWEVYRDRANSKRRAVEAEMIGLGARIEEINAELAEEDTRKERLKALQKNLELLAQRRKDKEQLLEQARKVNAALAELRKLVDAYSRQLEAAERKRNELHQRLDHRKQEQEDFARKVAKAKEIEAAYAGWQATRAELERWDAVAAQFREHEVRRQAPLMEIGAEQARLTKEIETLRLEEQTIRDQQATHIELEVQLITARKDLQQAEESLNQRSILDEQLQAARTRQAEANAENPRLRDEMTELKERIDKLSATEEPACPLCGRPMDQYERNQLLDQLNAEGTEMGDRFRANKAFMDEATAKVKDLEVQITSLSRMENQRLTLTQTVTRLSGQIETIQQKASEWETVGLQRLEQLQQVLTAGSFALESRRLLAQIDDELKAIGYDAAAHDHCRKMEAAARASEGEYRALEAARATLQPLEREIADMESQLTTSTTEITNLQHEYDEAAARLAAAQEGAPDLEAAERDLHELLEQENSLRMEVGAAQQKVEVLKDLKVRLKELSALREEQARLVSRYKQLEKAFGKDGVPALLIEQALPEIETRANELLDRLSAGNMSVRFATQAQFKDKRREDLKETLDILISDGAGTRDYELYSGGEAFRVNFAIRLALSEVLAKRAGARLQTLFIDEGFGNQDAMGRQHLIEAINLVSKDFKKVLVITHIDELKEAFPNRIEVEKTERGSVVRVV
jgi:exonuclease SbcC